MQRLYIKNTSKMKKNSFKIYLIATILSITVVAILIFNRDDTRVATPVDNLKNISQKKIVRPKHDIRGFNFDSHYKGKKVISIKADRFSVKHKKLGFVRFGLMNEALLDNVFVQLYGERNRVENKEIEKNAENKNKKLTFDNVFASDALKSLRVKRISSIVMKPVNIEIYDGQSIATTISASYASINLKKQNIVFKRRVKVVSGSRTLTTDWLVFFPKKAILQPEQNFVLKTPEKQLKGGNLITDIFLYPLLVDNETIKNK